MPILRTENISKSYTTAYGALPVLQNVSLSINRGELCSITGASGSGKTTLLNIIGLLDRANSGEIFLNGTAISILSENRLAQLRNRMIGFVFQSFHLLPHFSALDNVALPLLYRGVPKSLRRQRAAELLQQVGLEHRLPHRPEELSGGQCQRVAIARALVGKPAFLLADEPTGNLDSHSAEEIMSLFLSLNRTMGVTIIIVTHDSSVAAQCKRQIVLRDGRIVEDHALEA